MLRGRIRLLNHASDTHIRMQQECMDDIELVAGLQLGESEAVKYLVQEYAPALFRFAYYQMQDASSAEDVVAEVMVRVIASIGSFKHQQATFQAWVFRIARNLIADHFRASKRRPQISLDEWLETEPENEPGRDEPELELFLDREKLKAGYAEITQDLDEDQKQRVEKKVQPWKEFLKADTRIERLAKDIAEDFRNALSSSAGLSAVKERHVMA